MVIGQVEMMLEIVLLLLLLVMGGQLGEVELVLVLVLLLLVLVLLLLVVLLEIFEVLKVKVGCLVARVDMTIMSGLLLVLA